MNHKWNNENKALVKPVKTLKVWLVGILCIIFGLLSGYLFMIQKLQLMAAKAASVRVSMKSLMICPMLLVIGLFLLLAPSQVTSKAMQPGGKSKWVWILLVLIFGACVLTYFLFKRQVVNYGYDF